MLSIIIKIQLNNHLNCVIKRYWDSNWFTQDLTTITDHACSAVHCGGRSAAPRVPKSCLLCTDLFSKEYYHYIFIPSYLQIHGSLPFIFTISLSGSQRWETAWTKNIEWALGLRNDPNLAQLSNHYTTFPSLLRSLSENKHPWKFGSVAKIYSLNTETETVCLNLNIFFKTLVWMGAGKTVLFRNSSHYHFVFRKTMVRDEENFNS